MRDDELAQGRLQTIAQRLDREMAEAERRILAHHTNALSKWTKGQQLAIQRAEDLDAEALQVMQPASEQCVEKLNEDIEQQQSERMDVMDQSIQQRKEGEAQYIEELREMSYEREAEDAACIANCAESIRARGQELEERMWGTLDKVMDSVMQRGAREVLHLPVNFMNEVGRLHDQGELMVHLEKERSGWNQSQENDLKQICEEVDVEYDQVFQTLGKKLTEAWPANLPTKPVLDRLSQMANTEKTRLQALCEEVSAPIHSEIDAALHRCEVDYHGYEVRLQEVIMRTMDQRFKSEAAMRELKLALCRWRLDYQKTYHRTCAKIEEMKDQPTTPDYRSMMKDNPEGNVRRLERLRRIVYRTWERSHAPLQEMSAFVGRAAEACALGGGAGPLLAAYEEELRRYGALPLLEHADSPDLLNCWLDALSTKDMG
jgi:hypothetical protein